MEHSEETIKQALLSFIGFQSVKETLMKAIDPSDHSKDAEILRRVQKIMNEDPEVSMMIFCCSWRECCAANRFLNSGDGEDLIKIALNGAPSIEEAFKLGRTLGMSDEEIYNKMGK